jgi:hypothetical protein
MLPSRTALNGRRGWSAVVGLSTALVVLAAGQLPAASAEATAPVAASPAASAGFPAAHTSVGDRLAGPWRPTALPDAVAPVAPRAAARSAAAPVAARPAAARAVVARPAAARPAAPSLCTGDGWQERRGQAALASLRGGAERTGFRVEFKGARSGYMGLTHLEERRIEMFVRACGTQSDELLRHVMAHELGHAYDTTRMSPATRQAWLVARGIPLSTDWYGCSGCTDFATPAGDFAEVYAQWARGASSNRSQIAGDVPAAQLAALASQFFGA